MAENRGGRPRLSIARGAGCESQEKDEEPGTEVLIERNVAHGLRGAVGGRGSVRRLLRLPNMVEPR